MIFWFWTSPAINATPWCSRWRLGWGITLLFLPSHFPDLNLIKARERPPTFWHQGNVGGPWYVVSLRELLILSLCAIRTTLR